MAELGNVISGARSRLLLDNVPLFYCTNVSISEEIQFDPVEVLDELAVAEHVPVAYRVTFSAQRVRVRTVPIRNADGIIIMPKLSEILTSGSLTGTIEDSVGGGQLYNIERVRASRWNLNIGARGIVMEDIEFVAIRIKATE